MHPDFRWFTLRQRGDRWRVLLFRSEAPIPLHTRGFASEVAAMFCGQLWQTAGFIAPIKERKSA